MTEKTRMLLFRLGAVLLLLVIAAVMMVIGRGHTVYLDNKTLEYGGETYPALYRVVVEVRGVQAAKLNKRERGASTNIGQTFEMTLKITGEKGAEEVVSTHTLSLPYNMDGVVINLPGYLAGLPEEAYLSEFVPIAVEAEEETPEDALPGGDEFELGEF